MPEHLHIPFELATSKACIVLQKDLFCQILLVFMAFRNTLWHAESTSGHRWSGYFHDPLFAPSFLLCRKNPAGFVLSTGQTPKLFHLVGLNEGGFLFVFCFFSHRSTQNLISKDSGFFFVCFVVFFLFSR